MIPRLICLALVLFTSSIPEARDFKTIPTEATVGDAVLREMSGS